MYKLCVFIPEDHLEPVKDSMFAAGAGGMGNYDRCSWEVLGRGQFRPLPGSNAYMGETGETSRVAEYRVELLCDEAVITAVIAAMKASHPYEEPAYEVYRLESF